jgi:hypothetical protein
MPRITKLILAIGLVGGWAIVLYALFLARSSPAERRMVGRENDEPPYFASNLPIIVIDTSGRAIPDELRIVARMGVINNGGGRNSTAHALNEYDGRISIEIRGTFSQQFPKKSYALETQDELGKNYNVPLLGMPKENDWMGLRMGIRAGPDRFLVGQAAFRSRV